MKQPEHRSSRESSRVIHCNKTTGPHVLLTEPPFFFAHPTGRFPLNFHRPPRLRAFTLVEVLIAMSIFTVLCGVLFSLTSQGQRMYTRGTWQLNIQKQAQQALYLIQSDLGRAANQVVITAGNIQETFQPVNIWTPAATPLPNNTILNATTASVNKITSATAGPRAFLSWSIMEARTDQSAGAWCGCVLVYQNRTLRYWRSPAAPDFVGLDLGDLNQTLTAPPANFDLYSTTPAEFSGPRYRNRLILEDVESVELFYKEVANGQADAARWERSVGIRVTLRPALGNFYDRQRSVIEFTSIKLNRNVRLALK